ncbi:MAG: TPM domain-containing protein, partial [Alloprevotella sp.]|nr:TPM domain-containing protein [Alloprevotella sp.]
AFLWYICWRSSKCPKCGQHSYGYVGEKRVVLDGKRKIVKTYRCKKCGYEHNDTEDDPDSGGGGGGALATSMLLWGVGRALGGGGRSGGGGSFGGGSFGGGGSGGRF